MHCISSWHCPPIDWPLPWQPKGGQEFTSELSSQLSSQLASPPPPSPPVPSPPVVTQPVANPLPTAPEIRRLHRQSTLHCRRSGLLWVLWESQAHRTVLGVNPKKFHGLSPPRMPRSGMHFPCTRGHFQRTATLASR